MEGKLSSSSSTSLFSRRAVFIVHGLLGAYALLLAYVLGSILLGYKLPDGSFTTLSFVLLFFAFAQSLYELGMRKSLGFLCITSFVGLIAELIGTTTGIPFGKYYYTTTLGPQILGIPVVIPFAWFVIAYLTFSMVFQYRKNEATKREIVAFTALAAFGTMSWDLMIDPMFTSYHYWIWEGFSGPELSGVPLTNFLGWFIVSYIMVYFSIFLLFMLKRGSKKDGATLAQSTFIKRHNILDSRLAYVFLMIDGSIANLALGHYVVIAIGLATMAAFFVATFQIANRGRVRLIHEGAASESQLP